MIASNAILQNSCPTVRRLGLGAAFDLAKQYRQSKDSISQYNGKEIVVRGYVYVESKIGDDAVLGLVGLGKKSDSFEETILAVNCWFDKENAASFAGIKKQNITVKGTFDASGYSPALRPCKLVSKE